MQVAFHPPTGDRSPQRIVSPFNGEAFPIYPSTPHKPSFNMNDDLAAYFMEVLDKNTGRIRLPGLSRYVPPPAPASPAAGRPTGIEHKPATE